MVGAASAKSPVIPGGLDRLLGELAKFPFREQLHINAPRYGIEDAMSAYGKKIYLIGINR